MEHEIVRSIAAAQKDAQAADALARQHQPHIKAEVPDGSSPPDCCVFIFESLLSESQNGGFQVHPHPYGMRLNLEGLSHGLKTVHRTVFTAAALPPPFRVPLGVSKMPRSARSEAFLVRQKGLEPPTY